MNPQTMIIRFNCHTQGTAIITVRIEFEDDTLDAVQFRIAKDNVREMLRLSSRSYSNFRISFPVEQLANWTAGLAHISGCRVAEQGPEHPFRGV